MRTETEKFLRAFKKARDIFFTTSFGAIYIVDIMKGEREHSTSSLTAFAIYIFEIFLKLS